MVASRLLDRANETARLGSVLGAVPSMGGRVVLIEGEPGIGKTALLAYGRELASAAGFRVLRARGGELEQGFAYGVVRQLLERTISTASDLERRRWLAGSASLALPALEAREGSEKTAPALDAASATEHGLYWLIAGLAADGPLLVAVDDAHWADAASLRWLLYLARRVTDLPVAMILTTRVDEPGGQSPLVRRLTAEPDVERLTPQPLGAPAIAELVTAALGPSDPEFCSACGETCAGNPHLLGELLLELRAGNVAPESAAAEHVRRIGPTTVSRSTALRLSRLLSSATALAEGLAVLGGEGELHAAAALAELAPGDARAAADALADARILQPGRVLRFTHPIVRSSIYAQLPAARRAEAHARAARVLEHRGASADRLALHLMQAERSGDAWTVEQLRSAASAALGRGAPDAAARLLRRALEEPPPAPARVDVLRELGQAEALAFEPGSAARLLEALGLAVDARQRAQLALELSRLLVLEGQYGRIIEVLDAAIDGLDGDDVELRLELEATLIGAARVDRRLQSLAERRIARFRGSPPADSPGGRLMRVHLAVDGGMRCAPAAEVRALAESALAGGHLLAEEGPHSQPFNVATAWLSLAGGQERAEEEFAAGLAAAAERGSVLGFAVCSCWRTVTRLELGRLADAEADARNAWGATASSRFTPYGPTPHNSSWTFCLHEATWPRRAPSSRRSGTQRNQNRTRPTRCSTPTAWSPSPSATTGPRRMRCSSAAVARTSGASSTRRGCPGVGERRWPSTRSASE